MARTSIMAKTEDLQSDTGSVLFSFVQGEQLEYPVTLSFIDNASIGYTYEAVIIEGFNNPGQGEAPSIARPGATGDALTVWVPPWKGAWSGVTAYDRDDIVSYAGTTYILVSGTGYTSAVTPDTDTAMWLAYVPNKVYVQFPATLSTVASGWDADSQPTATSTIYGFFELRVTEPSGVRYVRTWKPVRGLIQFLYSPTEIVV